MSNDKSQAVGFPPGTKIGKYEIVERLGIGGQAIVYKALDPMLDRHVAIKQISSHLAEKPDFLERFRKEAQILAKLASSQPALVTIHELIQEERGLFIVMEFVPGHTLETMMNMSPGPAEPKAVLQILWRLAAGLHAVHSAGIIHRDIKPANLIVGDGLKVKIADFGVAAMAGGDTSMSLGTTKYMAPELYGGKAVDARADMYSLGFIAYEMLLGRTRFNEVFEEVVRDKHSEALRWMKWHGNEQVSAPPLNEVNPAIPKPLADIVAMMMVKNPDLRFATMEQLGRAIKASFSPRASGQRAPSAPPRQAPGAPTPDASQGSGSMPALDGEEELEVSPDYNPPDTAPLPPTKVPLRTKLILAGSVAAVLVMALIGWQVYKHINSQDARKSILNSLAEAKRAMELGKPESAKAPFDSIAKAFAADPAAKPLLDDALAAYDDNRHKDATIVFSAVVNLKCGQTNPAALATEADKAYSDGTDSDLKGSYTDAAASFNTAALLYGTVAKLYPVGDVGARCGVREHLALGRQAVGLASVAEGDKARQPLWAKANDEGAAAKAALDDAQRKQNNLGPWTGPMQTEIDQFSSTRTSCLLFWAAIDKARALVDAGQGPQARTSLEKDLLSVQIHQTEAQVQQVFRLKQQIDEKEFEGLFAGYVASAKDAIAQKNYQLAAEHLTKAYKLFKDDLAKGLSKAAIAKHMEEIRLLGDQCKMGGDYKFAIDKAAEARGNNDREGELAALKKALALVPSKETEDRINTILSDTAFEEGEALAKELKFAEAKTKLEESLKHRDNSRARALLKKITLSEDYQKLRKDADTAYNQQDYKKASELYQKALDIDPSDEDVRTKKNLCIFQVKYAEAQALLKDKKYDEANKAFQECKDLSPDRAQEIDQIMQDIQISRDYERTIAEGDAFFKDKKYSNARAKYGEAQKIKDTPQAKELIVQTHYQENLGRGKEELAQGRYRSALGMLKIAQSYSNTAEIKKLIEQAQAKVKEESKDDSP